MALSPNINNLEKDKFKDVSGATAVQVSVIETVGGGGSGTEYTEGDVDATFTGPVVQGEGPGNTATPLQIDASGNLKVSGTFGGSSSDVTEDAASLADPIGPQIMARRRDTLAGETTTDGDNVALNSTDKGELYVKHADTMTVGNAYETFSGSITAISQNVPAVFVNVRATVGLRISGTWTGTIAFQVSVNGTDYVTTEALPVASGVISTATNANGDWHIPTGGMKSFRVLSTAWTSGTATVEITACTASHVSEVYSETADNLKSQSFGSVTTADPSYVDGTTRSLSINTAGGLRIAATSLPLPTGAATAALQTQPGVDIGDVTINNASGASAVNIQDGGNSITVDGSVTANAGTNLNTSLLALESGGNLAAAATSLALLDNAISGSEMQVDVVTLPAVTQGTSPWAVSIIDGGNTAAVNVNSELSVSVDNSVLPNGAATETTLGVGVTALQVMDDWDETNRAAVNTIASQVGVQGNTGVVTANTQRVVLATDVALPAGTNSIGSVTSTPEKSSTATLSNVAASASSVTVLASNANRKKAIFLNDSTSVCRLKFGATASSTSYTIYMSRGDTYIEEGPTVYTGICDAIWDSATGNMRVTELT